jgi:hypothetical protein
MRTILTSLKKITTALALCLALAACPNPFEPPESSKPSEGGAGTFTLEIGGVQAGRTILPPALVQSDFDYYTLVFSASGKTGITEYRTNADLSDPVTLPAETWDLTVTAYIDSAQPNPAAQGSLAGIAINTGTNTSRSLALAPIIQAGATGTFRWDIQYPEDTTIASMTITPLDTVTGTPEQTLYFVGGTPLAEKNNYWPPFSLNTGYYRVVYSLGSGRHSTGREEYLHIYQNRESSFAYTFTADHFFASQVTSNGDSGPGTLRFAIENTPANSTIFIEEGLGTISLDSRLSISKSLTIKGNGVTLTRSASWTMVDSYSQLLCVGSSSDAITVTIGRVHFKDGRATTYGAAIYNYGETVNLESCVFSGNQTSGTNASGGAVYNNGAMNVKGCTFYNNSSAYWGGAVYKVYNSSGTLTLTGNLFYGNTASAGGPVVYGAGDTVGSGGYNVVDVPLGAGNDAQSGWTAASGDKTVNSLTVHPASFKLLPGSGAANVLTSLPAGYPTVDFYGNAIAAGAAAGAVQSAVSGSGYYLDLSVNDASWGGISAAPAPDAEGFVPAGTVTIMASPQSGYSFAHWLVNGAKAGSVNPLVLSVADHTTVQAVFVRIVTVSDFTDTTSAGTLRHALTNVQDGDIIRFSGVTAGVTTIELNSALPEVNKNITIEGNGVTLTRSSSWTATSDTSQLLYIPINYYADIIVNISRIHFKDGRATNYGAAIYNYTETVNLESCVFSGNQTSETNASGGAVYTYGAMSVKGCTFYNNSANKGSAICDSSGTLTLTGNLFYGNTGSSSPVARNYGTVTSGGYNVVDVPLGTGTTQSGWTAASGDKTVNSPTVHPASFKLLPESDAANVITSLPAGYPTIDFYGDTIAAGAAAGAVQSAASGYYLELLVNEASQGSISAVPAPDADGFASGTVAITASPQGGYDIAYWLVNGAKARPVNPLNLTLTEHTTVQAVFGRLVTVNNFSDSASAGTLRHALTNAQDGDIIRFSGVSAGVAAIALDSELPQISTSIIIEGNGITLTRSSSWNTTSDTSQLLYVFNSSADITVNISRVHFKNGRAVNYGAAIRNDGETVNLESCVFSGSQTSASDANGGAIYNAGTMNVKGCTFYNNSSAYRGGAVYNSSGTLTLTGNLFYGNTASAGGPVVYGAGGTVTSSGYNVVNVSLGTGTTQSGWTAASGDKTISGLILHPVSFKLVSGSGAANVITSLPAGYPSVDFYGNGLAAGAAAGAVQSAVSGSGYYYLELSVNDASRGSISADPVPDADGIVPAGTVAITASPQSGYDIAYWLVNGAKARPANPLNLTLTEHTTVQAVFSRLVTVNNFSDSTSAGTLRDALTNAQDGDIIRFSGVSAGTTAIQLTSALPELSKNITIEGNGVTLTRNASWTTTSNTSQLLYVYNSSADITVNISRVHFKNGRATTHGAAIRNDGETVNLESCVFSGNQAINSNNVYGGGAIYSGDYGTMSVKGCTFYNNSAGFFGGAIFTLGSLTLTGNLFYDNNAAQNPVVESYGGSGAISGGYNVVDVPLGNSYTQSGWVAASGDKTVTSPTVHLASFKLLPESGAANVITSLPEGYPAKDFYGDTIAAGAAAGAVQSAVSGSGYYLGFSVNDASRGSIGVSPPPDTNWFVSASTVTITAYPQSGYDLSQWLVNGVKIGDANPLNLNLDGHTSIQAIFGRIVTVNSFTDTTSSGTLRYALTNAQDEDIIRLSGVAAGVTTIELNSKLPEVNKNITIEGNGVTLTRSSSWNTTDTSQLLWIDPSRSNVRRVETVNISGVHFKNGGATTAGGAIRVDGGTVNLESCVFSGNHGSAIYNFGGFMSAKGCTFYNNGAEGQGGAFYTMNGTLTLTGNLFYDNNTASFTGGVRSGGYNVLVVPLSEWDAAPTDTTFNLLGIFGAPFDTSNFTPANGTLRQHIPSAPVGFPATDFYGVTRTWPGAPGAVK